MASVGGLVMFLWPLLVSPPDEVGHVTDAPFLFALILPVVIAVVLSELHSGGIDTKALAMLGVLTAIGAALRPMGAGVAGLETVFFLLVLAGRVYGAGFGFVLGTTTMFTSAILTGGIGPWLPFQMMASGWVGLGAGLLPDSIAGRALRGRAEIAVLALYGAVAAYAYGFLMNMWFWPFAIGAGTELSFVAGAPVVENLHRFVLFTLATSTFGWDTGRAITNVVATYPKNPLCLGLYNPWTENWYTDTSIRCIYPEMGPVVGYAVTCVYGLPDPNFSGRLSFMDVIDALDVIVQWALTGDFVRGKGGRTKPPPPGLSEIAARFARTAGPGGFLGAKWDSFVPGPRLWREVFRTCKPGAIGAVFASPRTQHWMALALVLAGFEVRDVIGHVQAQGMSKSGTVDKRIDRRRHDRDVVLRCTKWIRERCEALGLKPRDLDAACGTNGMGSHWTSAKSRPYVPTRERWAKLEPLLGPMPPEMEAQRLIIEARAPGEDWAKREVVGKGRASRPVVHLPDVV